MNEEDINALTTRAADLVPPSPVEVPPEGLSISDAARACGLSVDTLRYYEREQLLLDPAPRLPSGRRSYGERDLAWIAGLVMLRDTGMSIADIRKVAELSRTAGTAAHSRWNSPLDELRALGDVIPENAIHGARDTASGLAATYRSRLPVLHA